ncbi:uncharacterized protein LOC125469371 [Pyrus x bretschneideri]|uniref:uncharacterized protein LOC125469371 n=1 Tax=Pyrus x bretschneideri TaxID=225117 RepID=UPI002030F83D|nr:uncharacterized protein LOC125469371 [Pyrus x bretschneideri]
MVWNVRGAGGKPFSVTAKDLVRLNKVNIFAILEPRISGERAIEVIKGLGFSNYYVVDANGFSGGVWLLWNNEVVNLTVVACSSQTITAVVMDGQIQWMLTVVYASPCPRVRSHLWPYLDGVSAASKLPWLIAGDFNELIHSSEKKGGRPVNKNSGLGNWSSRNSLVDLGFIGAKFTWSKKNEHGEIVWERLDRGLCNIAWRHIFSEAYVRHLAKVKSDHCPLLIGLHSKHIPNPVLKAFRFQAMWMLHPDFEPFVNDTWSSAQGDARCKTIILSSELQSWNHNVFGCIFQKKRRLLARICGIQKALCICHVPYRFDLEKQLTNEYSTILEQEELFWLQKSRNTWLREGDKNTKFFHLSAVVRRRKNKLEGLNNSEGVWTDDKEALKSIVVNYFKDLFSFRITTTTMENLPHLFPCLIGEDLLVLNGDVTDDEIKACMFAIGGLKAPGPDGIPARFYQKFWHLCGKDVCDMVKVCFNTTQLPDNINNTFISLIPKVDNPTSMTQLRPISLCSTLYKVISKILVGKLRPFLHKLVSPTQVSFVPGRQIIDNVIVAQEILHKYRNTKGKKGFIAWKIDLSKAYDRLQWSFIREVLWEIGLRGKILELIMQCVTTVNYQTIVNGELTDSFSPQCGIRQGDPLSPYLFVLCMEKLSHIINGCITTKKWKPVKLSSNGPPVSHLFFADDLILFAEASSTQARLLKDCLDIFCAVSSQQVNFDKSCIYCSPNISRSKAIEIANICGSPLTSDLGHYLGVLLLHSRVNKETYGNIVEKVQRRLSAWKSNTLSMAGRLVYLQSVASAIPIYSMQSTRLPVSICDKIDKLNRNFLWGHTEDNSKIHLVKWETVSTPKFMGGLGLKDTHFMNQALLAKTGWKLMQRDPGLWAQVLKGKYLKHYDMVGACSAKFTNCSHTWRGILFGAQILPNGMRWRVGTGSQIHFWKDNWLESGVLENFATIPLSADMLEWTVEDFLTDDGWNVDLLYSCLPPDIVEHIFSLHVGIANHRDDKVIWSLTNSGTFSVKTAYLSLFGDDDIIPWKWNFIWKLKLPPKLVTFLWTIGHGKILTNVQRARRGFTNNPCCPICPNIEESMDHIFRSCRHSPSFWNGVGIPSEVAHSFALDFQSWMAINLRTHCSTIHGLPWNLIFASTLWYCWKGRNNLVFNDGQQPPVSPQKFIFQFARDWYDANKCSSSKPPRQIISIHWIHPPIGRYKINTDGSCKDPFRHISAGGLIRNSEGDWIKGFAANLGRGTIMEAELWGVFMGLSIAWDEGCRDVILECDSWDAVILIQKPILDSHPLYNLIIDCKEAIGKNWRCEVTHIYREMNVSADHMADLGHGLSLGLHLFVSPPTTANNCLVSDFIGRALPRAVLA